MVTLNINEELSKRFGTATDKRLCYKKGNKKIATEEAIIMWCEWVESIGNPESMKAWADKWTTKVKA